MYLIDTCVISEIRKGNNANAGVLDFFISPIADDAFYLSVVTMGELRRGVDHLINRNDLKQAQVLTEWLDSLLLNYKHHILSIDIDIALLWGRLSSPNPENTLDKQIAATALIYDLTVVTRNIKDFEKTGVKILNPFI